MASVRAVVRRRRDGHVVFDLDAVHAGVVVEALEQTRAVLTDDSDDADATDATDGTGATDETDGTDGAAAEDDFDAIVAGLGGLGDLGAGGGPGDVAPTGTADRSSQAPPEERDPVLRRLLPDAYLDDAEASAELRRLGGDSVRRSKVTAIDSVLEDLRQLQAQHGGVAVAPDRAVSWLTALNDARLALGTLLAVGEDDDLHAELDAYEDRLARGEGGDEPPEQAMRAYRIAVYDFLSALLEMVVRALDR